MDAQQVVEMNQDLGVIKMFADGGFFMWPILAVSFVAMAIAMERYFALTMRFSMNGQRFFNDIKRYITANDWKRAQEVCRQHPSVPLAQVLGAGLSHADLEVHEMETAMESQALYYVPSINARLEYLGTLANIATLLGLLGTISGLIASFSAVGGQNLAITREEALAGGISIAMYCTAFGLIVAIPTLLAHMYLSNKANRIVDDIEHYATSLKQLVQRIKTKTKIPSMDVDLGTTEKAEKSGKGVREAQEA